MKEKRSLHLRVQEMCDCYATGDPLKEMSKIKNEKDKDEAAVKWMALAALHGVNNNAEKITITRDAAGKVRVVAEYRKTELPSPEDEVSKKIVDTVREITHIEKDKGEIPLSLGIRNDSIALNIKLKAKKDKEEITIKFPE
jgi:hypothetical protein